MLGDSEDYAERPTAASLMATIHVTYIHMFNMSLKFSLIYISQAGPDDHFESSVQRLEIMEGGQRTAKAEGSSKSNKNVKMPIKLSSF